MKFQIILMATIFVAGTALVPDSQSPCLAQETGTAPAQEQSIVVDDDMNRFMRIRRDRDQNPVGMETSITRYVTKNSAGERVTVDLIGVVHIGQKEYFDQLNALFTKYDALLYELVAPEGTVIPQGGGERGFNQVSGIQQNMQGELGLEFQLEHIDYTVDNFVHADMTPDEFSKSMEENGESLFKMVLKGIGQGMAMQSKGGGSSDIDLLMALFSDDPQVKLRQAMAEQMMNMESGMVIFQGENGSTIIDHRNAKAFQVMLEEIESGKTHIGVFYGAGHLPDMDNRLMKKHGMKRAGQTWLQAWDLSEE